MATSSNHVVVIGAGVMGSGIAAHMANLGWKVSLLDIVPHELTEEEAAAGLTLNSETVRDRPVRTLWERAKKARPPHFYLPPTADTVRLGNVDDNLDWVSEADWVVEAVAEKMDVKRALYEKLEPLLREDTLITTNTSGLMIGELCEGRSESFRKRFVGTHFFNPPRYLKLLEIIPTRDTDPAVLARIERDAEDQWGKRVVVARDTPGFIANRIGMWIMVQAVHAAMETGLTVEEVDAITGPLIGRPKTASFRLNDLVGLDIMEDVAGNQYRRLPDDKYRDALQLPPPVQELIRRVWLGNKSGQGFYKREGKSFLALDLNSLEYRPAEKVEFDGLADLKRSNWHDKLNHLLMRDDKVGKFMRAHLIPALTYALTTAPEISDTLVGVDNVMKWGFGWEMGPFEMVDAIGIKPFTDYVAAQGLEPPQILTDLRDSSHASFYRHAIGTTSYYDYSKKLEETLPEDPRYLILADIKEKHKPLGGNADASIVDLGDKVLCVEFHTKMNALTPDVPPVILEALERAEKDNCGLVLGNQGPCFSAGFNLKAFLDAAEAEDWAKIDAYIAGLQKAAVAMRQAKVPVVAAIHGYTLGGGFEMALHTAMIVAAPESVVGLPETNVGVIPAGGGTATMTLRNPALEDRLRAFQRLRSGAISANADDARALGYLGENDQTCYNADQILATAKALAKQPVQPRQFEPVPGLGWVFKDEVERWLEAEHAAGNLTDHDCLLAKALVDIMSSSQEHLTEERMHHRERYQFVEAIKHKKSQERMRHMLETGKPLRN